MSGRGFSVVRAVAAALTGIIVLLLLFPFRGNSNGTWSVLGNRVPSGPSLSAVALGAVTLGVIAAGLTWWLLGLARKQRT
jgi:hypothetical protein